MLTNSPAPACPGCQSPVADSRAGVRVRDGQTREIIARRYGCGTLLSWCSVSGPAKHGACAALSEMEPTRASV